MPKKTDKPAEAKKVKTKVNKQVTSGRVYVTATFNNTLITITDDSGNTLYWGSSGASGFKGARKSTPFAATTAVEQVGRKAWDTGMREIEVFIKSPGGRKGAHH